MRVARIASAAVTLVAAGALAAAATATQPTKAHVTIVSVRAFPVTAQRGSSKGVLDPAKLNTVAATSALAFRVVVHNGTGIQQTHVHLVLSISRPSGMGGPTVHQVPLGTIPANNTRAVTFTNFGAIPFASRTSLWVSAAPGRREVYPVIFSLPGGNFNSPATPVVRNPPPVVGLDQRTALQRLESAGFEVLVISVSSRQPAGRVVGTRTGGGISVTGVPSHQVVEISVSNGHKPK